MSEKLPPPSRPAGLATGKWIAVALGGGVVLGALFIFGLLPRLDRQKELRATARENATGTTPVTVIRPVRSALGAPLTLPGNIQALAETTVSAHTGGYLRRRLVDIGDRVRGGQLLAEIDAPELDQQASELRSNLAQARAELQQQQANLELNRTTLGRFQSLGNQGAVSQQDVDERTAQFRAQQATVEAQRSTVRAREADLGRLAALQAYKQVRAPFSGTVTARNVDSGALVGTGSNGENNLFKVARTDRLRIFINIPQIFAPAVRVGQIARVRVREYPDAFVGRIARTAGALDPAARTLLTEVQIDNRKGRLLPGMYAEVQMESRRTEPLLIIPANVLVIRSAGPQVAVVGADHRVHLQKIGLGRDLGASLEVLTGLRGSERLVVNPGDEIVPGARVEIAPG